MSPGFYDLAIYADLYFPIRSISESQSEISRLESLLDKAFESQETLEKSNKDQAEALEAEMQKVEALTEDLEQLQKEFVEERKMVKKLQEEKDSLRSRLDSKIEKVDFDLNFDVTVHLCINFWF